MMKIVLFLVVMLGMAILDYRYLIYKKKLKKRDICSYILAMLIVAAIGVYYLSDIYREGFVHLILRLFQVKG